MKKCKYCGKELKDKMNIRCDVCDSAWQEGRVSGIEKNREEVRLAMTILNR